jgi:hypothetical protein
MNRLLPWLPALIAALVGGVVWSPVLELELLGWDSYPMIAAGKVSGLGELFGTFGEELMDGRYPLGRYWRPLVHLSFALDHALWGLDPFGYHASDLTLLAASAGLTAALATRLLRLSPVAGLVAGLVAGFAFALHPVHFEILPVAPRRADALAVFFTLLALFVAGLGARSPLRAAMVGLICALAFAAKETGIVALAAAGVFWFAWGDEQSHESIGPRCARTARTFWPALVPVALAIVMRTVVLDGLGGSRSSSLTQGLSSLHSLAAAYLRRLALPPTLVRAEWAGSVTLGAGIAALVLAAFLLKKGGARLGSTLGVLAGWGAVLLVLTSMSGLGHDWYLFPFLPLWALALGALAGGAWTAFAGDEPQLKVAAALSLALVVTLIAVPATASPLGDEALDFHAASDAERRFLKQFERGVRAAPPGAGLTFERFPTELFLLDEEGGRTFHRKIYIMGHYSLEAYADLVLGPGRVRVHFPGRPSDRPGGPDVIDVQAVPAPMGFRPQSR